VSSTLALLTNGPNEWYMNIVRKLAKHGSTWLQQDRELDRRFAWTLRKQIMDSGFFWSYAYVRDPVKAVPFRLKVNHIITGPHKVDRPDITGPDFCESYDLTEGDCAGPDQFRYRTWLRVVDSEPLKKIRLHRFTNVRGGKPLQKVHGHTPFYVWSPDSVKLRGADEPWDFDLEDPGDATVILDARMPI
jgi:hypothetical protein